MNLIRFGWIYAPLRYFMTFLYLCSIVYVILLGICVIRVSNFQFGMSRDFGKCLPFVLPAIIIVCHFAFVTKASYSAFISVILDEHTDVMQNRYWFKFKVVRGNNDKFFRRVLWKASAVMSLDPQTLWQCELIKTEKEPQGRRRRFCQV